MKSNLSQEQTQVVLHASGPALVIAGAGSGKTHTLAHRVKYLIDSGVNPKKILTLTFSDKAAKELSVRLKKVCECFVEAKTFHSLGFSVLKKFGDKLNLNPNKIELVKSYEIKNSVLSTFKKLNSENIKVADVIKAIGDAKKSLVDSSNSRAFFANNFSIADAGIYATCFSDYEKFKLANDKIDFDDMICKAVKLLQSNETVRKEFGKFSYVLMDECQDTNQAQFELARLLVDINNLMLIGDSKQSIYAFQGARPDLTIYNFLDDHNAKLYLLKDNYRSKPHIVNLGNKLASHMNERFDSNMNAIKKGDKKNIQFNWFINESSESSFIINEILNLKDTTNLRWKDFAILYRVNTMSTSFEIDLILHDIPHVIYGQDSFFLRQEVIDVMSFLKLSVNPEKYHRNLLDIINIPSVHYKLSSRRIGSTIIKNYVQKPSPNYWNNFVTSSFPSYLKEAVQDLKDFLKGVSDCETIKDKIDYIFNECYDNYLNKEKTSSEESETEEFSVKNEIMEVFGRFSSLEQLFAYQSKMELFEKRSKDPNFDGVQIMTLHKSKGLEWNTVFIAGMSSGMLPHIKAIEDEEIAEERRLAYVGITRAKEEVYLSGISTKGKKQLLPSRFITEELQLELNTFEDSYL